MNRKLIERERRSTMRNLYSRLFSLIPPHPTKMSISDKLEQVIIYIRNFQRHLEELRQWKSMQLADQDANKRATSELRPNLKLIDSDSSMEINLVAGSHMKFALSEIISNIENEGAEVLTVSYNNVGNINIHSIHCQVAEFYRNGFDRSRLLQRLKTLIEE